MLSRYFLLATSCTAFACTIAGAQTSAQPPAQAPTQSPAQPPTRSYVPERKIPMDPAVAVGQLPNGLRYYVRRNVIPARRAELRLVVNAGSILEDNDQRGMAHFVEHMAFNGTTHFKKNELIRYLESIGMRFGADLNAHTNFDETTYELAIPADTATLHKALVILDDWARGVQFDSANVVAERNVIIEEWRLRTGAASRIQQVHDTVMYHGTSYPVRWPIGTVESIQNANPAALKRFYKDWYRPDLMTVVAVGDFDQAAMIRAITARFGSLKMPAKPRPRPAVVPKLPNVPTVSLVQSAEQKMWTAGILFHRPKSTFGSGSEGRFRDARIDDIFMQVVNDRLGQTIQQPGTALQQASISLGKLQRGSSLYQLAITAKPGKLEPGITAAVSEIARIARDGVTPLELDRIQKQWMRQADEAVNAAPRPSDALASQFMRNALDGSVSIEPPEVRALLTSTIPTIHASELQRVAQAIRSDSAPLVVVTIPRDSTSSTTQATLLAALDSVKSATIVPYDLQLVNAPLVAYPPKPGVVTRMKSTPSVKVTEWLLTNGVRVLLKPVQNGDDKVYLSGTRPGGFSRADPADYPSALMAASLIGGSGVGNYSNEDLSRRFAGTIALGGTGIGAYDESVTGQAGTRPEDLSLMFQIIYLKFTAPRIDSALVARWRGEASQVQPDIVALTLDGFMRNNNPFGRPIIGPAIDSVDAQRALAFYRTRFSDAAGFTFVLTGAFKPEKIRPLVEQYLGGLPSSARVAGHDTVVAAFHDFGVRPTPGPVRHLLVTNDIDPVSRTSIVYSAPLPFTRENTARLQALSAVVQARLTYTLRQRMGGIYTAQVDAGASKVPYTRGQLSIAYSADPKRVEELHTALLAQLDTLKIVGPTESELHDAKESQRRALEVVERRADVWAQRLITYAANDWPVEGLSAEATKKMDDVSADQVRDLARQLLNDPQRIEVVTLPQQFVPQPAVTPTS